MSERSAATPVKARRTRGAARGVPQRQVGTTISSSFLVVGVPPFLHFLQQVRPCRDGSCKHRAAGWLAGWPAGWLAGWLASSSPKQKGKVVCELVLLPVPWSLQHMNEDGEPNDPSDDDVVLDDQTIEAKGRPGRMRRTLQKIRGAEIEREIERERER